MESRFIVKSLIIIWVIVLVTIVGGSAYMISEINKMVEEQTDVVSGSNSLRVVNSTSKDLQPQTFYAEDEITVHETLQPTTVGNYMQYQKHYTFLQPTVTANELQGSFYNHNTVGTIQ
jgi:flagellar basal body-associated protein FliL